MSICVFIYVSRQVRHVNIYVEQCQARADSNSPSCALVEARLPEEKEQEWRPWALGLLGLAFFLRDSVTLQVCSRLKTMANACCTLYEVAAGAVRNSDPGCKGLACDLVSDKLVVHWPA